MTTLTHPTQEEFKNDLVRVLVHRKPSCKIELDVYAYPLLIQKAKKAAIKTVGKEVEVPGFRRGKAPEEMVLKKFPGAIDKETHSQLANLSYTEAQRLAKVPLLNNNSSISFDLKKEGEHETHLAFSFETEPSIPSPDPKSFSPKPVQKAEVGEKQIEEAIHQMRFFYAEWKPIEDRSIQEGDYILIDLDTVDGEVRQQVFHRIRFEVSKERMANWMKNLVIGAKVGDVLEGMSEADETASEEEKKEFKPKKVILTIYRAEEATLPALDDEFAKKVGSDDIAAMRTSITSALNDQANKAVQEKLKEQVNDFLSQNYSFELPLSLLDAEKKHRINQALQNHKFKINWDKMSQEERKKTEEQVEKEAAEAVRLFYLARQVVQDANITVTHKEIQEEAVATMRSFGSSHEEKISKELFALAFSKVLLAKAQTYILGQQLTS